MKRWLENEKRWLENEKRWLKNMKRWLEVGLVFAAAGFAACTRAEAQLETTVACSESFYRMVEGRVPTGDGQGHGPDLGSDEWKSVVEFKLGIRGDADVPSRDGDAWCVHIDEIIRSGGRSSAAARTPGEAGPSFSCDGVREGSVEATICTDAELSALDRELSGVYAAASAKATNEQPPVLKAEQRGWIKGRDDCWKSDDPRECVRAEYERRIAELQARYRLVAFEGPVRFRCDGDPTNEVVATYFQTEPPTLIAERGDRVSLMYQQPSASGTRYQGANEKLWEHQGKATITWGYGAPEMQCQKVASE